MDANRPSLAERFCGWLAAPPYILDPIRAAFGGRIGLDPHRIPDVRMIRSTR